VSCPEADLEDLSRRLKISTPPRHHHHIKQTRRGKLFNPNTDPIPMRRTTEPESISDATSSSSPPHNTPTSHQRDPPASRQLFNHRKDDPVRFAVLARPSSTDGRPPPTPKSSGDYVSASSTSSYAHSLTSEGPSSKSSTIQSQEG
jgi:protein SMG6